MFSLLKIINLNWLFLILLGIIWGLAFVSIEASLRSFSPLHIAFFRIIIGACFISFFTLFWERKNIKKGKNFSKKIISFSIGVAIFSNVLPFLLLSWAQISVSSMFAGVFMTFVPLVILPLAHFFIPDEKLTLKKIIGFLIGFLGTMVLIDINFILKDFNYDNILPKIACFGATVSYAIGSIIIKKSPKTSQLIFSSTSLIFATIIILPVLFLNRVIVEEIKIVSIIGIVFLGIFPTGMATVLKVYIIKNAGPSFLSLVNYQVPLWAIIFGFMFFNENLPKEILFGLFLIVIGLIITQSKSNYLKRLKSFSTLKLQIKRINQKK